MAFDERLWNRIAPIKYLLSNLLHAFQSNRSHFLRSLNYGVHITSMWDWCITMAEKNNMLYANCEAKCLLSQSMDTLVLNSVRCGMRCYAIHSIQFVWLRCSRLGSSSSFIAQIFFFFNLKWSRRSRKDKTKTGRRIGGEVVEFTAYESIYIISMKYRKLLCNRDAPKTYTKTYTIPEIDDGTSGEAKPHFNVRNIDLCVCDDDHDASRYMHFSLLLSFTGSSLFGCMCVCGMQTFVSNRPEKCYLCAAHNVQN